MAYNAVLTFLKLRNRSINRHLEIEIFISHLAFRKKSIRWTMNGKSCSVNMECVSVTPFNLHSVSSSID
jgi:hypothetical protein